MNPLIQKLIGTCICIFALAILSAAIFAVTAASAPHDKEDKWMVATALSVVIALFAVVVAIILGMISIWV